MKRTLIVLTVAAQLAATSLWAQTDATTTTETATGTTTGTFGSDWSTTMGTALMSDDGMTLRADSELITQFGTLSDAEKEILRRDCMMHMQTTGAADASTSTDATADTGQELTETPEAEVAGTGDATAATGTESAMGMQVTAEQMDQICAATKDL